MNLAENIGVGPRISPEHLVAAQQKVAAMTLKEKERLGDEIFLTQPALLGAVLVQPRMGVSMEKVEFLLHFLFQCYVAMQESGFEWPTISEDDLDYHVTRISSITNFQSKLEGEQQRQGISQYGESHPEPWLFGWVLGELNTWERAVTAEESDRHVILAALTICECIARLKHSASIQNSTDACH